MGYSKKKLGKTAFLKECIRAGDLVLSCLEENEVKKDISAIVMLSLAIKTLVSTGIAREKILASVEKQILEEEEWRDIVQ